MKKINKNKALHYKRSIRYKFLAVTTVLLAISVTTYLFTASFVFKADKTQWVNADSRLTVKSVSSDLQGLFERVENKLDLIAWTYSQKNIKTSFIGKMLSSEGNIVSIYQSHDYKKLSQPLFQNKKFLSRYEISRQTPNSKTIPFNAVLQSGMALWNASGEKKAPLVGFAKSIVLDSEANRPVKKFVLIAYVNVEKFMQKMAAPKYSQIKVFNQYGDELFHTPNDQPINLELFNKAKESKVSFQVLKLEGMGDKSLVAFAKGLKNQLYVTAKVSNQKAFSAVEQFSLKFILFTMTVLTIIFITAIIFSKSIIRSFARLIFSMREVAKYKLNTQIKINAEMEALHRTTRFAAIGELAEQAAHEMLNPLTSIMVRLHRMNDRQIKQGHEEVKLLKEISSAWGSDFEKGGFDQLVKNWTKPSSVKAELQLWDEDLSNLNEIEKNLEVQISDIKTDIEFILNESQRINKIIQSMRSINTMHAEKHQCQLDELVERGVNIMLDLIDKLNIKIKLKLTATSTNVYLDSDQFIQAFTNLLRNSIQAVNFKAKQNLGFKPSIEVETFNVGNTIEIYIKDNGVGISPENQKKLFEHQFTTKSKAEGTGLGLSISRKFIRAFKGDIYLHSTSIDDGSVFVIKLPLQQQNTGEAA